jgi:hypothetical protein
MCLEKMGIVFTYACIYGVVGLSATFVITKINKSETLIILAYDIWLSLYWEGASLYMYQ